MHAKLSKSSKKMKCFEHILKYIEHIEAHAWHWAQRGFGPQVPLAPAMKPGSATAKWWPQESFRVFQKDMRPDEKAKESGQKTAHVGDPKGTERGPGDRNGTSRRWSTSSSRRMS